MPNWLDVEYLQKVRQEEKSLKDKFSDAVPYYYLEISHQLLTECEKDFPHPAQVKSVI